MASLTELDIATFPVGRLVETCPVARVVERVSVARFKPTLPVRCAVELLMAGK